MLIWFEMELSVQMESLNVAVGSYDIWHDGYRYTEYPSESKKNSKNRK